MARKPMRQPDRETLLRKVAYHEAGHAVLCLFFGGLNQFDIVTIVPRRRSAGSVELLPGPTPIILNPAILGIDPSEQKRQRLLVLLAGVEAERLVDPALSEGCGGGSDFKKAVRLASKIYPADFDGDLLRFLESLQAETGEHVQRLRVPIARLAKELLEKKTVTYAQAKALMGSEAPHGS